MSYPFDRGEANRSLVLFCLELADRIDNQDVAARLRSAALKAGTAITYAGSPKKPALLDEILRPVQKVLDENKSQVAAALGVSNAALPTTIGNIVIGEYIAGDKHVSGHSISQGSGTQRVDVQPVERWHELEPRIDLKQLAEELSLLRASIEQSTESPERENAKEQISNAEEAAKHGDGPKMLSALAVAGKMVMDFAIKVGAGLTVEAIKKANGM
jgi:hypothetical protein